MYDILSRCFTTKIRYNGYGRICWEICFVTGGAKGIGRAIVCMFAKAGAKVAFVIMIKRQATS